MAKEVKKEKKAEAQPVSTEKEASFKMRGFLVEPMITEKSHQLMAENKYVFKIADSANKKQVAEAVREKYQVTVEKVNVINIHPKKRVYGRTTGWKSGHRKAVVKLKEGDKIEIFEGV